MVNAREDTSCQVTDQSNSVASDKLEGVAAIANEIGSTPRRTHYLLEKRMIPAGKIGGIWIASKQRLREHYAKLTSGQAA